MKIDKLYYNIDGKIKHVAKSSEQLNKIYINSEIKSGKRF
jgi:hypothetical protein